MKHNKWLWIWIVIGTLAIFLVPLAMDWLIIGNSFPSNIDNTDWVSFFGGYIGAIVGAIVSLVGIVITIRHTSKENRRDRELQIRPYCLVTKTTKEKIQPGTEIKLAMFEYNPTKAQDFYQAEHARYRAYIEVRNVGIGPALNCSIRQEQYCTYLPQERVELNGYEEVRCGCISPNESIYIAFDAIYCVNMPDEKRKWSVGIENALALFAKHYRQCNVPFVVSYTDMLGTRYSQSFHCSIHFGSAFDSKNNPIEGVRCNVSIHRDNDPTADQDS